MAQNTNDPTREAASDRVVRDHVKAVIRKLTPPSSGPGRNPLSTSP